MTAAADALGIARPPLADAEQVADIRARVADLPTDGYRRVHALPRREAEKTGRADPIQNASIVS
ncbi:hypothetical protein G4G27_21885 [Sphingomonas sp. So64.6b]|uniref:hypothetical protein n=1 Tax=Sphingomonas sp. So64.6b TaxID=2997354 RepID=UPI0016046C68|nr:hypothetical protein [Sphingomonas sp. So64.6b]QNA86332.1 hypothetical protein G4G27_21885 [Sphingomonas sp. So64.6b]